MALQFSRASIIAYRHVRREGLGIIRDRDANRRLADPSLRDRLTPIGRSEGQKIHTAPAGGFVASYFSIAPQAEGGSAVVAFVKALYRHVHNRAGGLATRRGSP